MKKLIMTIIMVIMGTITIAEENHPDNWMIWDRSYATFAEASKVIKYWGADAPSQYLKCTIDTNDSYVWDNGTHLDIFAYCANNADDDYNVYFHIYIYGNDKMKTIMNKALNGGTEFVFPTVKYSDTVTGHTGDATFFYYQK